MTFDVVTNVDWPRLAQAGCTMRIELSGPVTLPVAASTDRDADGKANNVRYIPIRHRSSPSRKCGPAITPVNHASPIPK